MSVAETDTINEIADRLSAAIEKSNVAAVDRLWSDDIAVWRVGARRDNDKARARSHRLVHHSHRAATLRILDRRLFCGSVGGFVQQHILHPTGHAGQLISMRVWIVLKVDPDGLINRIDEYFDLAEIAPHDGLARATEKME